ncbi:MAG TPA: hypothetical protein V6C58_04690 [Allocoleopsis sp.]
MYLIFAIAQNIFVLIKRLNPVIKVNRDCCHVLMFIRPMRESIKELFIDLKNSTETWFFADKLLILA